MFAASARADGPQSEDVIGGKVIGLRGFPLAAVNPKNMQALVYDAVQGLYIPSSAGLAGAGGSTGQIQINIDGALQGITVGPGLIVTNGTLQTNLSASQVCFAVGPLNGDLTGDLCNPQLSPGAAARNLGQAGGALTGDYPNPGLNATAIFAALGTPGGDLGGASFTEPTVVGLQGFPISTVTPTVGSALVWDGASYVPTPQTPGITQITGDVVVGPGSGLQTASIPVGTVTTQQMAQQPASSVLGNATTLTGPVTFVPVASGLKFANGALGLDPNLGFSGPQTIGSSCFAFNNGILVSVTAGTCSGGVELTADDGVTVLTADDATTHLTADGSNPLTPCTENVKWDFSDTCHTLVLTYW